MPTEQQPAGERFDTWCLVEQWRPVVGFEAQYEVSDRGRVRRSGRAHRTGNGRGGGVRVGRVLKLHTDDDRYMRVQLWARGRPFMKLVHVLVAAAFLGPCPDGLECNHKDGDKSNNRPSNLEYVTRSQNNAHAWRTGLRRPGRLITGEAHHASKLTAAQVAQIRALYRPRVYGIIRLGREFGVSHKTIHDVVTGRTWKESSAA